MTEHNPEPEHLDAAQTATIADREGTEVNRVLRKFGGRHLIFRTTPSSHRILPRPYVLVSSIRGPIWLFYGAGQIWLTHRKYREFAGWMARVPRFRFKEVAAIADRLAPALEKFIQYCNDSGIEGTVLIEKKVIEFHWTFGFELEKENQKNEHSRSLDENFRELSDRFVAVRKELERNPN